MSETTIQSPPGILHFTKQGKPLKAPSGIIVSWGRFSKYAKTWIEVFKVELIKKESWAFNFKDSFLGSELLLLDYERLNEVTIYVPNMELGSWDFSFKTVGYNIDVHLKRCHETPLDLTVKSLNTADAIFHTWPNDDGRFKIYTHVGSRVARYKFKQPQPKTHLNRANLNSAETWQDLRKYIESTTKAGFSPLRGDVCDLVKHISEKDIERTQHIELVKAGIEEMKLDFDYGADDDI